MNQAGDGAEEPETPLNCRIEDSVVRFPRSQYDFMIEVVIYFETVCLRRVIVLDTNRDELTTMDGDDRPR